MNKKCIFALLTAFIIPCCIPVSAYNSDELNKRLISCTPSKDFKADSSTIYQISGLTDSICIYKIQHNGIGNQSDLICKVPINKMREMTSPNPIIVQRLKNQYCVISIKSLNKPKKTYY